MEYFTTEKLHIINENTHWITGAKISTCFSNILQAFSKLEKLKHVGNDILLCAEKTCEPATASIPVSAHAVVQPRAMHRPEPGDVHLYSVRGGLGLDSC